jgi:hypothetical protein
VLTFLYVLLHLFRKRNGFLLLSRHGRTPTSHDDADLFLLKLSFVDYVRSLDLFSSGVGKKEE